MSRRRSVEELARSLLPELGLKAEGLLVDEFSVAMEQLRELAEGDPVAQQPVAVRDDTLAAEEPRVGRADDQERHRLRARDEAPAHAAQHVPQRRVEGRLARGVAPLLDDRDALPQITDRVAQ